MRMSTLYEIPLIITDLYWDLFSDSGILRESVFCGSGWRSLSRLVITRWAFQTYSWYVVTVFWLFGCHIILRHIVQLFREWLHSRNPELPSPCANLFFKSLTWLSLELYSSANKIWRGWILGDTINVSSGFPLSSFCNAFHFRIKCS